MHIFYTPELSGNTYTLDETESKHCIRVLRLEKGNEITLVDGRGGWFTAEIADPNPKRCAVNVIKSELNFGQRNFQVHIAIAPTKNIERIEWFLEKATEIGIDRVTPLLCRYSERKEIKNERLEKVMVSAMKQSLKAYLPQLDELTKFNDFIKQPFSGQKFIAHCEEQHRELLKNTIKHGENYLILIGPEGDFSTEEIRLAIDAGFVPVSLGESRLRTETAGVVACHTFNLLNEM
ncbi:ribosomal RNA small subunit methyltransferase E [Aquipluma nitroreducens]|uniref:Ribosomal RNA small subunit methyltransferase E n=1 Tax=Aquipluma nitroreducens TaxID=2010828 RepID=A0A5K7S5T7_9BACT|nr:16S rRNA (uracil(1498)-N(3))-methyltransferase [Aquipluma nitroreducens]BBE16850.1 ribosomal RNA small subunit methyltransferase E [Aquipluma nitroreducens]